MRPQPVAVRRAECVHLAVRRADVHAPVRDRRRRVEVRAAEEAGLRGPRPDHPARARQAVHVAVVGADVQPPAGVRERTLDRTLGDVPVPHDAAVIGVERPHVAVPVADVEAIADEERRALGRADPVLPVDLAVPDAERDHLAVDTVPAVLRVARRPVEECLVDGAVRVRADRRRRGDAAVRAVLPRVLPGARADRGERSLVRREEEPVVADGRRELDQAAGLVAPYDAERRAERDLHRARPVGREAVRRPRDSGRRRLRHGFGGDVLGRGRATLVRALVQPVDDDGGHCAGQEDGQHGENDEQAAHVRRRLARGLERPEVERRRLTGGVRRLERRLPAPGRDRDLRAAGHRLLAEVDRLRRIHARRVDELDDEVRATACRDRRPAT